MEFCDLNFDDSFISPILDIIDPSDKEAGCKGWLSKGAPGQGFPDGYSTGCSNSAVQKVKSRAIK